MVCLLTGCGATESADAAGEGAAPPPRDAAPGAADLQDADAGHAADDTTRQADPQAAGEVRIRVGGHPVTVEVADDEAKRQRGLMFRESLPEDHGMLFVYDSERQLSFWMRNTLIPLDVAFIDAGGRIVDIQQMEPMTDETHTTRAPAMYALEMNRGWFAEHGVEVGDTVEF